MSWTYRKKTSEQIEYWCNSKIREEEFGFRDIDHFKNWYQEKEKVCFYCGLKEEESQEVVHRGFLVSKRFPLSGVFSQGVNRGYWLEVERKDPNGIYDEDNCELSCYFCNNDKSDVFNDKQYKDFVKDRPGFIKKLLNKK